MAIDNLDNELGKLRIQKSRKGKSRGGGGKLFLSILLIAGAAVAGYFYYSKVTAAIPVKVIRVQSETASGSGGDASGAAALIAGGYVIPRNKIEVSSKIVGVVKDIRVEQGDLIKQGEVILTIDDEEYQAQVKIAEARVANLKARLAELKTGSRPQEIEAAKASVVSAEATYKMRKLDWERIQRLAEKKIISQQELDQMRQAHDVAAAALDQAKKNAELVIIGPRKEVIAATEAQLHEAEANLEFARTQLDYTVIRAPISGTILEKVAKKGELVTNMNFGGTRGAKSSAVSMADLNDLQIELDISENDIPKVKMGQKCEIKLDSDPDKVFKGEVDEISPQADRQKAQVQVKVKVFNPEGALIRPEVNARVTFLEEEKPKAVAAANDPPAAPRVWIPKNAIVTGEKGQMVYIASGNTAVARTVKTKGEEGPRGVEVIEGLLGSESLIIEPLDKIKDGVKIAVTTS